MQLPPLCFCITVILTGGPIFSAASLSQSIFLPIPFLVLLANPVVLQLFDGRLYNRALLQVATFWEYCLNNILKNNIEWQGADVCNNFHFSFEWTGWNGSGFWLDDLSILPPLPPYLPLLDHTWWQAHQKGIKTACHMSLMWDYFMSVHLKTIAVRHQKHNIAELLLKNLFLASCP